jgi:hypothetical protein
MGPRRRGPRSGSEPCALFARRARTRELAGFQYGRAGWTEAHAQFCRSVYVSGLTQAKKAMSYRANYNVSANN